MRPQSECRVCVSAALMDGPGTVRQLAQRTGWSVGKVREALNNMVKAGDALVQGRVPGLRRRVPLYVRAMRTEAAANESPFQSLIQAWAGPRVAAM